MSRAGYDFLIHPLLSDAYIAMFNSGSLAWREVMKGYFSRIAQRNRRLSVDLVFAEKEFLPWLPTFMDHLVMPGKVPFVLDFDDAVFHNYDQPGSLANRVFLGGKIDRLMREARVVTVGCEYLAERAAAAGAKSIHYVPTVVDVARYQTGPAPKSKECTIGWIGSPSTAKYLSIVDDVLRQLCRTQNAKVVLVGSGTKQTDHGFPCTIFPWSEVTEAQLISSFNIGIMPLTDGLWERGKCGYKLIQYMACARPVIASPVGANKTIVAHGVEGFLAASQADWTKQLTELLASHELREDMGKRGRTKVEEHYSLTRGTERLKVAFDHALAS